MWGCTDGFWAPTTQCASICTEQDVLLKLLNNVFAKEKKKRKSAFFWYPMPLEWPFPVSIRSTASVRHIYTKGMPSSPSAKGAVIDSVFSLLLLIK